MKYDEPIGSEASKVRSWRLQTKTGPEKKAPRSCVEALVIDVSLSLSLLALI